jgi:hypothetical protein
VSNPGSVPLSHKPSAANHHRHRQFSLEIDWPASAG